MRKLNQSATKRFIRLLNMLDKDAEKLIPQYGTQALHLQRGDALEYDHEAGYLFYAALLLSEQNNEYYYRFTFIVIDFRDQQDDYTSLCVYPVAIQNGDEKSQSDTAFRLQNGYANCINTELQDKMVNFAQAWLHIMEHLSPFSSNSPGEEPTPAA